MIKPAKATALAVPTLSPRTARSGIESFTRSQETTSEMGHKLFLPVMSND